MDTRIMGVVLSGQPQDDSLPEADVSADTTWDGRSGQWTPYSGAIREEQDGNRPVTAAEVAAIVREVMAEMRIYVLESDITEAQNAVKGVIEQTYF